MITDSRRATRIGLSSGESLYVAAAPIDVRLALDPNGFVEIDGVFINGAQVTQLVEAEVPSIITPLRLEPELAGKEG